MDGLRLESDVKRHDKFGADAHVMRLSMYRRPALTGHGGQRALLPYGISIAIAPARESPRLREDQSGEGNSTG